MFFIIMAVLAALVVGFLLGVYCADCAHIEDKRIDAMYRAGMKSANDRGWLDDVR